MFNNDIQIAKFRLRRTLNKTADFLRTYDPEEFSEHYYGQFVNTTLTLPEAMRQVIYSTLFYLEILKLCF